MSNDKRRNTESKFIAPKGYKTILNMPFDLAFEISMEDAFHLPIYIPETQDMGKFNKYYEF